MDNRIATVEHQQANTEIMLKDLKGELEKINRNVETILQKLPWVVGRVLLIILSFFTVLIFCANTISRMWSCGLTI